MTATLVRCLQARIEVAEPVLEVRRARASALRGDAAWRRRLERYARGETLILDVRLSAVIEGDAARREELPFGHEAVWIDRPATPEVVGEQLREIAHREFKPVAAGLGDRGVRLSRAADAIPVELVIAPAVAERLGPTAPIAAQTRGSGSAGASTAGRARRSHARPAAATPPPTVPDDPPADGIDRGRASGGASSDAVGVGELRETIALSLARGASLGHVEAESIEPADLDSEQKAVLWLFAWSCVAQEDEWIVRPGEEWT